MHLLRVPARFARVLICLLLVPLLLPAGALAQPGTVSTARDDELSDIAREGELLVRFQDGVTIEERQQLLFDAGGRIEESFESLDTELALVDPGSTKEAIEMLEADPRVAYAEPNYYVRIMDAPRFPNDPQFYNDWGLHNEGQYVNGNPGTPDADIDAPEAWELTTGSRDVVVAVIDTGIDFTQPDLGGGTRDSLLMWVNPGEDCDGCRIDGVDNDGNGYVDDWRGWDWANDDNNPYDDNGHGTHVAGIIGAQGDNGVGGAGVNWNVSLLALKFLDEAGGGDVADAVAALTYAADMGIQITNNSWGSPYYSQTLYDAIAEVDARGLLFVAAAGNDGVDADAIGTFPAAYNLPNILSVAATDSNDQLAWFTNYGPGAVDIGAPGVGIYSTWATNIGNDHRFANGTSMATPFVAGAAALVKSRFPDASHLGLKALLLSSADPVSWLADKVGAGGRLNVNNAVRCNGPTIWLESPRSGFAVASGQEVTVSAIASECANSLAGNSSFAVTVNGQTLDLTNRGDGLYEGSFSPGEVGPIVVSASAQSDNGSDEMTVTGKVVRDYRYQNVPFNWIDATDGGVRSSIVEDEGAERVPLPFQFNFYEDVYEDITISANGFITFGDSRAEGFSNLPIPHRAIPNGFAAPFWDDLNPQAGGEIWYRTIGEAPSRSFVVSWIGVPHYNDVGDATFQVILHEGSNGVEFQYVDVDFGRQEYDFGRSASIGIEQATGLLGVQFAYEEDAARRYAGEMGLLFTAKNQGDPIIETASFENAIVGDDFLAQLDASGGTEPYHWSVGEGELPPGLNLNPDSGEISGVPTTPGTYEVTIALTDSSDPARSASQWYKLLVVRGYALEDVPFDPINARDGGTDLHVTDKDGYRQVDLPFHFTFYDEEFSVIQVSPNGYITFGDEPADSFTNTAIPDRSAPNGFAAPFWDFLEPESGGGVFSLVVGEAPNRRLVVTWADVPHLPDTGPATFSVILEEGSNNIVFQYPDIVFDDDIVWTSFNYGKSATIGIENPAGTAGVQFSHNEASLEAYHGQKGIRFRPLSNGPRPPEITTLPVTEAVINQPYAYQPGAYSEGTQSWQLLSGPEGMEIDPATGAVSWTPTALGTYDVALQVTDENGVDAQEYQLIVQIGPTEEIVLAPVEGWDSHDGVPLSEIQIGDLLQSDDSWLFVRPESWVSLSFADGVPAGATIQSITVVIEHHEEYGTPEGSIVWEAGGGTLSEPVALASLQPEISPGLDGDKIIEWDVSEWINSPELVAGLTFVFRDNATDDQTLIDQIFVVVRYVAES